MLESEYVFFPFSSFSRQLHEFLSILLFRLSIQSMSVLFLFLSLSLFLSPGEACAEDRYANEEQDRS